MAVKPFLNTAIRRGAIVLLTPAARPHQSARTWPIYQLLFAYWEYCSSSTARYSPGRQKPRAGTSNALRRGASAKEDAEPRERDLAVAGDPAGNVAASYRPARSGYRGPRMSLTAATREEVRPRAVASSNYAERALPDRVRVDLRDGSEAVLTRDRRFPALCRSRRTNPHRARNSQSPDARSDGNAWLRAGSANCRNNLYARILRNVASAATIRHSPGTRRSHLRLVLRRG